ncbi:MAG: DEAD/DEAH box helicase [Candidatus Heimdallarchaeota archaeon]|nr:DEAD/DEAH box helicase [Candidatus Heimdallarchaeota archaeon]
MKFQDYNLNTQIKRALDEMGIHTPTEIQSSAIPKLLNGQRTHVLAQAKTGTGKTLAFAIPMANQINPKHKSVQAVILVPTRELCKQVYSVIAKLTKYRRLKAVEVYGGVSLENQRREIKSGAQIVIATPGRLMDLYRRRIISFDNVKFVVLDEADRMLDMGFLPDIKFILFEAMENVSPRLLLFSATMLKQITKVAQQFSKGEKLVEINVSKDDLTVANCKQYYYRVNSSKHKYSTFVSILKEEKPKSSIIFVNTRRWGDKLRKQLSQEKNLYLRFSTLSGNKTQKQRELVLRNFRQKKIDCLIATNVAARGLDIPHVTHIFNFDLPREGPEIYVHRIGRTSRMENEGKAISFAVDDQMAMLRKIEDLTKRPIERLYLSDKSNNNSKSKPNQSRPNQSRPNQSRPNQSRPNQSKKNYSKSKSKSKYKSKSASFYDNKKRNQPAIHASD